MTPEQAVLLQMEALEFAREYFGSQLQPKRPRLVLTTTSPPCYLQLWKGDTVKEIIVINHSLSSKDFLAGVGEEASHYWHAQENNAVNERVCGIMPCIDQHSPVDEHEQQTFIEFGKLRNLEEFVGRLGGLAFFQRKGGNVEAYANGTEWTTKGHPRHFDDLQHQTGYELAQEVMRAETAGRSMPLTLRRQLLHCMTLEEAITLTQPYRTETRREIEGRR